MQFAVVKLTTYSFRCKRHWLNGRLLSCGGLFFDCGSALTSAQLQWRLEKSSVIYFDVTSVTGSSDWSRDWCLTSFIITCQKTARCWKTDDCGSSVVGNAISSYEQERMQTCSYRWSLFISYCKLTTYCQLKSQIGEKYLRFKFERSSAHGRVCRSRTCINEKALVLMTYVMEPFCDSLSALVIQPSRNRPRYGSCPSVCLSVTVRAFCTSSELENEKVYPVKKQKFARTSM